LKTELSLCWPKPWNSRRAHPAKIRSVSPKDEPLHNNEDEAEDVSSDEDTDEIDDIRKYKEKRFIISYYSHKTNWNNTLLIKAATSYPNFINIEK